MHTLARKPTATRQTTSAKPKTLGRANFEQCDGLSSILHLRCMIGNQASQPMPEANSAPVGGNSAATKIAHFAHDFSRIPVHANVAIKLQTKLTVNTPGDVYEQEADRMADQVMATPAHTDVSGTPRGIQRFSGQSNGHMDAAPASVDRVLGEPGIPLEPGLRSDMETRFGHDFSRVRVHADAPAGLSARDVAALAYTVGHHVVFAPGRFAPTTPAGRHLVAHELTHVLQQTGPAALPRSRHPAVLTSRSGGTRLARQSDIESVRNAARDLVHVHLPGADTRLPLDVERALRRIAGQGGEAGKAATRLLNELGGLTNIASEQRDLNATNAVAREFLRRHPRQWHAESSSVSSTIRALERLANSEGGEASARRARELASQLRELEASLGERQRDRSLGQRVTQYNASKPKPDVTGKTPLKPIKASKTATEPVAKPTPEPKPAAKTTNIVTPKIPLRQAIRGSVGLAGGMAAGMAIGLLGSYFKAKYDAWSVDKQLREMQPEIEARITAQAASALRTMVAMPEAKLYANVTISSTVVTVMEGYNVGETSPSLKLEAVTVGLMPLNFTAHSMDAGYGWSSFTQQYTTAVPLETPPLEDLIAYAKASQLPLEGLRQHIGAHLREAGASTSSDSGAGGRRSAYWRERLQQLEGS